MHMLKSYAAINDFRSGKNEKEKNFHGNPAFKYLIAYQKLIIKRHPQHNLTHTS